MEYIQLSDIEDELLKPLIQPSDIEYANDAVAQLAVDVGINPSGVTVPLHFKVKRFAVATACERRAGLVTGVNPRSFQGTDGADAYEIKRKAYATTIKELEATITAQMLTQKNTNEPIDYFSMTLRRA